jgi:hypothetical protein
MLQARNVEDVKDFVIELIDTYIQELEVDVPEELFLPISIQDSINEGTMLTKEGAKYLESNILTPKLQKQIEALGQYSNSSLISRVEDASIYVDAYYLYCRPGTYTV